MSAFFCGVFIVLFIDGIIERRYGWAAFAACLAIFDGIAAIGAK